MNMPSNAPARQSPGRLLKMRDVERETSLHRATIYRHIKRGDFPQPIRLTKDRVAWSERDIEAWKKDIITRPDP